MSEVRKVIGVIENLVAKPNGIAFPSVRVWIRGANDYVTHGLDRLFPERGTVYLHISACDNEHPQRNQIGLFNCVESPGQSAEWEVDSTSRHLAKVVDYPSLERKSDQLSFWEWLLIFKDGSPCNILLNQGIVYVRRGKRELIGPFVTSPDRKLVPREPTFVYDGAEPLSLEISGRKCGFVDTDLLPRGNPIVLDPRDAIHRRLKLAGKMGSLEWLSRAKSQELSTALAGVAVADGSEWVMEDLPRGLELLVSSGRLDERLAESLLQIEEVEKALEGAWKKKHLDVIKKAEEEIGVLKTAAETVKQNIQQLKKQVADFESKKESLENELLDLIGRIEAAKTQAQKVFEMELKRLAESPASMAVLGAWISNGNKQTDRGKPMIKVLKAGSELQKEANLEAALFNNLKSCHLSPAVAAEITTVCCAALKAGHPIAIRSFFSDLLANAVTIALGQPAIVWADVPAGLLDPVDWLDLVVPEYKQFPQVLQNTNRSDISLVLGSLRSAVLEQALGIRKPSAVLLLTLEGNTTMQVGTDFPVGPLIDERIIRFTPGKAVSSWSAFPDFATQLPEVAAMGADKFAEIGDALLKLPLFKLSAYEIIFRRAYAALVKSCEKPEDASRLFFKYWCMPRCATEDVLGILKTYREKWANDNGLTQLRESMENNG